jgi:hypothetical protein
MTGPSLAPLIIPIAGTLFLTAWLTLVFFAGRLPRRAAGHPADVAGPANTRHSSPQRMGDVRAVFEVER